MNDVDVWIAEVPESTAPSEASSVLDEVERTRLGGFTGAASARAYLALHLLARQVAAAATGSPAHAVEFDRTCAVCGNQHGRPTVVHHPCLHISLTRTTSWVGVALTRAGPVGIDLEQVAAVAFHGFAEVALHPRERGPGGIRQHATAWVRKESALKALGIGLLLDPATVLTPPTGHPTVLVAGTAPVTVTDLVLEPSAAHTHVAALALCGDPAEVNVHRMMLW